MNVTDEIYKEYLRKIRTSDNKKTKKNLSYAKVIRRHVSGLRFTALNTNNKGLAKICMTRANYFENELKKALAYNNFKAKN